MKLVSLLFGGTEETAIIPDSGKIWFKSCWEKQVELVRMWEKVNEEELHIVQYRPLLFQCKDEI